MKIIVLLILGLLFFGCMGENGNKDTNIENKTEPAPIKIVTGNQKNQTRTDTPIDTTIDNSTIIPKKQFDYTLEPNQPFGIYFINVSGANHSNSMLIKKGNLDILVDSGSEESASIVIDFLRSKGVDDIELYISTNDDPRNSGGISQLADKIKIENFWWSGVSDNLNYKKTLENTKADLKIVRSGEKIDLNGINIEILTPKEPLFDDHNNDGVSFRLSEWNFSMFISGPIQTGAQGRLINEQADKIKAEVMTAPFYGSGSGTSNIGIFLITAKPKIIIIDGSGDESAPNGGSRDPFRRLMKQYGITYYETYLKPIKITVDEKGYGIS